MATTRGSAEPATWSSWREATRICLSARSLRSTIAVALIVGTALFAINQLDVVVAGRATGRVWLKTALTYVVPFLVANYGLLVGTRRKKRAGHQGVSPEARRTQTGQGD